MDLSQHRTVAPLGAGPVEASPGSAVRCRPISDSDLDAVVRVLRRGFPDRDESYWRTGLSRLARLPRAGSTPQYGYLLDHEGEAVGVLLTIYAPVAPSGSQAPRCNLSSWYVDPRYRGYGVLLDTVAMRDRRSTYVNVSPAPHSLEMHKLRGFAPYCGGQSVLLPALSRRPPGQRVCRWTEDDRFGLSDHQVEMMRHHVAYGCIGLICSGGAEVRPVLLLPRRMKLSDRQRSGSGLPCVQMVYGPSGADLARWAGTIGRHLIVHHAMPWMLVDADGPVPGVVGHYFNGRKRKYARGPDRPALGDSTYTELVLFGP